VSAEAVLAIVIFSAIGAATAVWIASRILDRISLHMHLRALRLKAAELNRHRITVAFNLNRDMK
jgi:hypothetical protein